MTAFAAKARPVLEAMEKDQAPTTALALLKRFLGSYKPESTLYKGDEKSTVKVPTPE